MKLHKSNKETGYALLEYCAGAAIIAIVLWAAMQSLGGNISSLLASIGDWALARANEINTGSAQ